MKFLKISLVIFSLSVCIFACSKSNSNNGLNASIQGNWNFDGGKFEFITGNITAYDTTINASSGDYVNFTADGKVYTQIQGTKDTATYSLLGSKQIIINNLGAMDTATISILTQTNLTLINKSPTFDTSYNGIPISGYLQTTLNLSR